MTADHDFVLCFRGFRVSRGSTQPPSQSRPEASHVATIIVALLSASLPISAVYCGVFCLELSRPTEHRRDRMGRREGKKKNELGGRSGRREFFTPGNFAGR